MGKLRQLLRKFMITKSAAETSTQPRSMSSQKRISKSESEKRSSKSSDVEDDQQDDDELDDILPTRDSWDEHQEGSDFRVYQNTIDIPIVTLQEDNGDSSEQSGSGSQPITLIEQPNSDGHISPSFLYKHKCQKLFLELDDHMPYGTEPLWTPTDDEISLLMTKWTDQATDWWKFQRELGESVYEFLFNEAEDIKLLFPQAKCYGDQWKNNPRFRRQALRFAQAIDDIVQRLHIPQDLDNFLYQLGSWHVRYIERGMHAGMWALFKQAIQHAALKFMLQPINESQSDDNHCNKEIQQQNEQLTDLWQKLSVMIVQKMYVGFADTLISEYCQAHCGCSQLHVAAAGNQK